MCTMQARQGKERGRERGREEGIGIKYAHERVAVHNGGHCVRHGGELKHGFEKPL